MTIDEAITALKQLQGLYPQYIFKQFLPALKLGIEALKRLQDWRQRGMTMACFTLPGETPE